MRGFALWVGLATLAVSTPVQLAAEVVAAVPGFGDGNELSPEELAELQQTVRVAEDAVKSAQKDVADLDLEVGHTDEITGRLLARLDIVRRSSRAPDELPRATLDVGVTPLSDGDEGSPGVCTLDYQEVTARRFTTIPHSGLTEGWTACTTMTGLPTTQRDSTAMVHLTRRSSRSNTVKGEEVIFGPEIMVEADLPFSDLAAGLALVHDTARDLEAELRPATRRHDQPY